MSGERGRQTYIGLDVIRFGAAVAVAVYHLGYWWWLTEQAAPSGKTFNLAFAPVAGLARWGYVGVPVFFVLSGFIIASSALGRSSAEFLRSRALRLYPAVWICAPITLAVVWGQPDLLQKAIRSFALWPTGPWVSGVYWTLGVEIVFYLMVAASLTVGLSLWRFGAALGIAGSMFWLLRAADFATGRRLEPWFAAIETSVAGSLLVTQACFFGVGIALWAIERDGLSVAKAVLLACFVIASCVAVLAGARFHIQQWGGSSRDALQAPLLWLLAAIAVAASIRYQRGIWQRFGRWGSATRTAGLATYPLYLVHSELGAMIMERSRLAPWAALALAMTMVVLLAFLVVKLERLPRSILRRVLHARSFSRPAADLP